MMPRSTVWLPLLNLVGLMVLLGWILVRIGLLEAVTVLVHVAIGSLFISVTLLPGPASQLTGVIAS